MPSPTPAFETSRWRWLLRPGLEYHLLALTLFTVVAGLIPLSIYKYSGDNWGFPFYKLLPIAGLGLALFMVTSIAMRLLAAWRMTAAKILACALFAVGAYLLLAHVYAPIEIGQIDGSELGSTEPVLYSVIELGLLAVMVVVFVLLARGHGLEIAALFSVLLLLVWVGYVGVQAVEYRGHVETAQQPTGAGAADIDGNVYHIVLDSARTDFFLRALEEMSSQAAFAGFDLFRNNISNYITTGPSSTSYFTGTYYRDDYKKWIGGWRRNRGIFRAMSDRGYKIWMYAPFANWNHRNVDRFLYNIDLYEEEIGFAPAGLYDLMQVWLASLAPNALTNEALPASAWLRDRIFTLLTGETKGHLAAEIHSHAGVLMLQRLRQDEALRADHGQYVYAHAALPHAPFVFDRDCQLVGGGKERPNRYLEQTKCAITLVVGFLEELKRRGRYDAATLILHADTGCCVGKVGQDDPAAGPTTLGTSNRGLLDSINALLMIKLPHGTGPLRILDRPTQLVDLFPTVLDILDLQPTHAVDGRSVYGSDDGGRDARFGLDPAKKFGHKFIYVRVEDQTDLKGSALTVIGPAADPSIW